MIDANSQFLNDADTLTADYMGERGKRITPVSGVNIGIVYANRTVTDQNLAVSGALERNFVELKGVGSSLFVNADCFCYCRSIHGARRS